ncbi:MAG: phosphopantothenate--cysteine ligase [Streptococcaceae bacterium]|jgi:phosphopantothenate-cysteine ligase|nr:phosphopantothenate--cysteine ligase [Streptococcaceae bacterium]
MRILITAGGTTEAIDSVRGITNHSTGKLGAIIAECFAAKNHYVKFITSSHTILPSQNPNIHVSIITNTEQLLTILTSQLTTQTFDSVIHSMAVSDYTPVFTNSQEGFAIKLENKLKQGLSVNQAFTTITKSSKIFPVKKKISSTSENLIIILKRNSKVIQKIKKLQPQTLLVGFKLLVSVSKKELLTIARKSMKEAQADFFIANDLTEINEKKHHAYLLNNQNHLYQESFTKKEIATMLFGQIRKRIYQK